MSDGQIRADVRFIRNMKFVGVSDSGHPLALDTPLAGGEGTAPTPMEMVLVALGACTGMDVVSILRKMRVELGDLEISLEGRRKEEHPKTFTHITLIYRFKGRGLAADKLQRAVELSQEKYCPVSATLRPTTKISYRIETQEM